MIASICLKYSTNHRTWIKESLFPDIEVISRNEEGGWDSIIPTNHDWSF